MKYIYILIAAFFITPLSAQFDVKLNVDNTNKRLKVLIRNTVSNAPTTSQNISSINMKLLGPKVDNIISIHAGDYTIQMPNADKIITMSSVSLPSPTNWMQNQWVTVVSYNLTPGMEYTSAEDFTVQPDLDMDNSDVDDPIMSVQAIGLFNIPLNIAMTSLPIRLTHFGVKSDGNQVICNWSTSSEINNAGFEIQHSRNGSKFEKIGWVDSKANSNEKMNYQFIDTDPYTGNNYYRLRQIDLDGSTWYSDIELVKYEPSHRAISIFPNPASDVLYIKGVDEGQTISVYSINGELLQSNKYTKKGIDISRLSKGVFFIVSNINGKKDSQRFIVN